MQQKFDKSQLISILLMGLMLFGFTWYMNKNAKQQEEQKQIEQVTQQVNSDVKDTLVQEEETPVEGGIVDMSNDKLDIKINTLGGQLEQVQLKEWKAYDPTTRDKEVKEHRKPLFLIDKTSKFSLSIPTDKGVIETDKLVFTPSQSEEGIVMTAVSPFGGNVEFTYKFVPNESNGKDAETDYSVDFLVKTASINVVKQPQVSWNNKTISTEKGRQQELSYTEFRYSLNNYKHTDYDTNGFEEEEDKLDWISVKQQFFATILESQSGFVNAKGEQKALEDETMLKDFNFTAEVPVSRLDGDIDQKYTWNFLPLDYDKLSDYKASVDGKTVDKQFEYNIPFGWTSWLDIVYLKVYKLLSKWGVSAGIIIMILTLVVKLITSPIMYKQYIQGAKMRVLKPEIDELNEKYKDGDAVKKQQETMKLYNKAGVNPLAGCLPALIQIPIFYSLYRFFPNNIHLRGKSFLWADDLTAYDSIHSWATNIPILSSVYGNHISLFTILYCIVLLIYTKMNSSSMQQPTQEGMPDMRFMMYLMPVVFIFFLNSYASGLSWYYLVSNAVNIIIILVIKYVIIDEKKIHQKIQDNKAKPAKKKSKWQEKMQNLMAQAQEQQKQQKAQVKKK